MDSIKTGAGHCPADVKAKIENTFGADITIIKLKAFISKPI